MKISIRSDVRVEEIDGEAILLDRNGAVVHRVSQGGTEALSLVRQGVDEADVPAHLVAAVAELTDAGVIKASDWSRRRLLRTGGASLAGAALITVALVSPAAAASGSVTVPLQKSGPGNVNPSLTTLCLGGATNNAPRGTCVFTRTEGATPTITVTITATGGTNNTGRELFILQSTSPTQCVGGTTSSVGTWAASPATQTFSAPIVGGATRFVVSLQISGGGGNDNSSSTVATLA